MTTVLAVANQKGGVAKTTTVASLGAALVDLDRRVLVVDLDPQGCLTFSLGHNPDRLEASVHDVLTGDVPVADVLLDTDDGVKLLPATIDLAGAEALLLMRPGREFALKRALAPVLDDFDVIIVDCPPSLGVLTLNGLTAAQQVLVPLQCETLAHRGVGQLLRTVSEVQQITNPDLVLLGALPTLYDARTTHSRDVLSDVSDRYDLRCWPRRFLGRCGSRRRRRPARRSWRDARTRVARRIVNWRIIFRRTGPVTPSSSPSRRTRELPDRARVTQRSATTSSPRCSRTMSPRTDVAIGRRHCLGYGNPRPLGARGGIEDGDRAGYRNQQ